MALDPMIARGVQPIDVTNTLAQIGQFRQRDQALQQNAEQNAFYRNRFAQEQKGVADETALRERYAEMEQFSQAPPEIKAKYVELQMQKHPEFAQTPFAQMPPDQAFEGMRRGLAARLGVNLDDAKQMGALYKVDQGGKPVYMPAEQASGMSPWQEAAGGAAQSGPATDLQYYMGLDPERQQRVLEYRRASPETAQATAEARAVGTKTGERMAAIDTKIANFSNMEDALDLATLLIPSATGSNVGAVADRVAGAFGYTPTGAEATASLRVLAAKVLENVPRMEGPQSDRDVQMYQEAAGQLGDPTVPRNAKMAAIRTIRQLTTKYKVRNAANGGAASAGAPSNVIRYDAKGNRKP